jgi:hypothetical protein
MATSRDNQSMLLGSGRPPSRSGASGSAGNVNIKSALSVSGRVITGGGQLAAALTARSLESPSKRAITSPVDVFKQAAGLGQRDGMGTAILPNFPGSAMPSHRDEVAQAALQVNGWQQQPQPQAAMNAAPAFAAGPGDEYHPSIATARRVPLIVAARPEEAEVASPFTAALMQQQQLQPRGRGTGPEPEVAGSDAATPATEDSSWRDNERRRAHRAQRGSLSAPAPLPPAAGMNEQPNEAPAAATEMVTTGSA